MIERITIIGLGLIGGSIAKAIKSLNVEREVSAFDKKEVLDAAVDAGCIDAALNSIEEVFNADLVFICLPVDLTIYTLEKLAPNLHDGIIVTDVCGVKSPIQAKWDSLNCQGIYIGGHPMTGKEKGGFENSDPLLFENSVYIISDTVKKYPESQDFLKLIQSLGAKIQLVNPDVHDQLVANVSHVPQLLSVALMNSAAKKDGKINFLDFAAGGFRDMTRVASSDYSIWDPVIKQNKKEILSALESISNEIELYKKLISSQDSELLGDKFESARVKRDEIPKNTKGFLSPLHDLFVYVKDQPGVISKISTTLYEKGINIKDMELLKIREGTGGTFRLSFETEKDAQAANTVLKQIGFITK